MSYNKGFFILKIDDIKFKSIIGYLLIVWLRIVGTFQLQTWAS